MDAVGCEWIPRWTCQWGVLSIESAKLCKPRWEGGVIFFGEVLCTCGEICEEEKVAFPRTKFQQYPPPHTAIVRACVLVSCEFIGNIGTSVSKKAAKSFDSVCAFAGVRVNSARKYWCRLECVASVLSTFRVTPGTDPTRCLRRVFIPSQVFRTFWPEDR